MYDRTYNSSKPASNDPRFLFDLSKYYKIWFSDKPEDFLGIENELAFIRMRKDNPNAKLFFIYSSICLSPDALDKLKLFCKNYNIRPFDFDSIEEQDLVHDYDKKLYSFAKKEIAHRLNQTGGSMASAADCLRLIVPNIVKHGIYSDFDLEIKLSQLNADMVSLRAPLLFPADMLSLTSSMTLMSSNSDFLAFSVCSEHNPSLSIEALIAVRNLQEIIIQNYEGTFSWEKISPKLKVEEFIKYPKLKDLLDQFHINYPENPTIFYFRTYLASLPDLQAEKGQPEPIKTFLMKLSVINISGPGIYCSLYKDLFPKGYSHIPVPVPSNDSNWLPFLKKYELSNLGYYGVIDQLVEHKNSAHGAMSTKLSGKKEALSDQSWMEAGKLAKQNREEKIQNSAIVVQGALRRQLFWNKNCAKESLFINLNKIAADKLILLPVRDENYALALRRASAGLKLPIVRMILEYREKKGIKIDINATSESSDKTALDWVLSAKSSRKTDIEAQKQIVNLLKKAGALTAEEKESSNLFLSKKGM
ncbi:MAG: hypothetical protein H0T84_08765 [Tatlockia sp.]|nr:hypothetical protein [Tatlockia sp.]